MGDPDEAVHFWRMQRSAPVSGCTCGARRYMQLGTDGSTPRGTQRHVECEHLRPPANAICAATRDNGERSNASFLSGPWP
ncbi:MULTISPECIES: hypothetical protein [unclassified Xanthomonas]|uniref:hypothetical protein n=1 Tax=unclassified Xanthomonas TaxID=2643310 RepID=UPI0028832C32|nr:MULTISPECIES: hypothetical protein [unclassified Xanthomonas]